MGDVVAEESHGKHPSPVGVVDAAGGVELVALCDVDSEHLEQGAAELEKLQGKRPKTFKQYADLLKVPELEAVIIGTPPHWHALQLIASLERGLDVYCEKPIAVAVEWGRALADTARRTAPTWSSPNN